MPPTPLPRTFELLAYTKDNLCSALANDFLPAMEIANKHRTRYLDKYLSKLNAVTIIAEKDYTDTDYLDDYAAYYVKCFVSYPRRCKRLHFFSSKINEKHFLRVVEGKGTKRELIRFQEAYIGFIVARPLPDAIIGRTVLRTYDDDNGRRQYPCVKQYPVSLFGIDLTVQSLVFQEQDTVMAACATVALWSAFNKTKDLFSSRSPTPAEITRAASQFVYHSRSVPSHGLTVQQMTNAIRHVGLEPEVIPVTGNTPLVSLVYAYLKMGLPVILGVDVEGAGMHAITLVGYSLTKQRVRDREVSHGDTGDPQEIEIRTPMIGLRIDGLFAHDDRIGPFVRLAVESFVPVDKAKDPAIVLIAELPPDTAGFSQKWRIHPKTIIVPVFHKIRVTFEDIEKLLLKLTEVLRDMHDPSKIIEWDLHLTWTNEYKRTVKRSKLIRNETLRRVLLNHHPKYIWRAILRIDGRDAMELLGDATDMSRGFPLYQAIWYNLSDKSIFHQHLTSIEFGDVCLTVLGQRFREFLKQWTQRPL
jgi:hypothetical protein